jgi:galactonate dehydratase
MKITDIKILRADRYLFINVETDAGITGIGEAGAWSFPEATIGALMEFRSSLIGEDPFLIEHHWQSLYRWTYFRGSIISSAISAIDIALWDIKGKALGVPVYELLGGKCRDRVRTYAPVFEFSAEKMAEGCLMLKEKGFTAARLMITGPVRAERGDIQDSINSYRVHAAVEKVQKCREAVGRDFDLCLEVHRSMNPAEASVFVKSVEPYAPMFIEDPIPPDNYQIMAEIAGKTSIPIATGERFINIHEFELLLSRGAAKYVRPDVCVVGGLSASKKIAAIAEAHFAGIIPHNPLGPVSTAACLQLDACIPNFTIQEFPSFYMENGDNGMMVDPFELEQGYLIIPDAPGIGIELVSDIQERFPVKNGGQHLKRQLAYDGSVRDV